MAMGMRERAEFEARISAMEARIAALESQVKQLNRGPGRPKKEQVDGTAKAAD